MTSTSISESSAKIERIYIDTSAFYALLDRADKFHEPARALWPSLLEDQVSLSTSNYVVSETLTLLQFRLGFDAARLWHRDILGVLEVYWADRETYRQALDLWMNLGRRRFSLVDCVSCITMVRHQIEKAFCFKPSYAEQGFQVLPRITERHPAAETANPYTPGTHSLTS